VTWDEIVVPMQRMGSIKRQDMDNFSIDDTGSPPSVQKAVDRMERHIFQNTYNKHNYKIWRLAAHIHPLLNKTLFLSCSPNLPELDLWLLPL
jgi:hypothetical protein